ncbi:hypothetical protein [Janthinobacterium sp. HLX7-2]|uniref:hypothetical protein n=1 Tax=Janthinobacterium sp. HLX7-2 TaxID=1259331 RepID=UPI003F24F02C
MSIAVAAVIRTPVCLRLLQALLGLCAVLAAWPLCGAWSSAPAPDVLVGGYALGSVAALLSAAGGVFLLFLLRWRRKPQALDISPVGQLRLAVYLEHGAVPGTGAGGLPAQAGPLSAVLPVSPVPPVPPLPALPPLLRLLPGSTLWPSLLVLCLVDGAGRRTAVLVQRGRSCAAFRQLAVACRAIAARGKEE